MAGAEQQRTARERLLAAATELLGQSGDAGISTREICLRADVRAPTLYHHFGDKQGLIDAAVSQALTDFLRAGRGPARTKDPVNDIRRLWNAQVSFGLNNPTLYKLIFGMPRTGRRLPAERELRELLLEVMNRAVEQQLLAVSPETAATYLLAANVGAVLSLVERLPATDRGLADGLLDAVLATILRDGEAAPGRRPTAPSTGDAALMLSLALQDSDPEQLGSAEQALLHEWLTRLMGGRKN